MKKLKKIIVTFLEINIFSQRFYANFKICLLDYLLFLCINNLRSRRILICKFSTSVVLRFITSIAIIKMI